MDLEKISHLPNYFSGRSSPGQQDLRSVFVREPEEGISERYTRIFPSHVNRDENVKAHPLWGNLAAIGAPDRINAAWTISDLIPNEIADLRWKNKGGKYRVPPSTYFRPNFFVIGVEVGCVEPTQEKTRQLRGLRGPDLFGFSFTRYDHHPFLVGSSVLKVDEQQISCGEIFRVPLPEIVSYEAKPELVSRIIKELRKIHPV